MAKKKTDQRKRMPHPMQPIGLDQLGVARFKENAIVTWLYKELDKATGSMSLNRIAYYFLNDHFSQEDYEQFNQLIGYSVQGYCDISSIRNKVKDAAWE